MKCIKNLTFYLTTTKTKLPFHCQNHHNEDDDVADDHHVQLKHPLLRYIHIYKAIDVLIYIHKKTYTYSYKHNRIMCHLNADK